MRKTLRTPAHDLLLSLLREARQRAGLTQAEAAARLGKPQSFIAKVENGERRLDVIEFLAFVHAVQDDPLALIAKLVQVKMPKARRGRT